MTNVQTRANSRSSSENKPPVTPTKASATHADFMHLYHRVFPAEISPAVQPSLRSSNSKAEQPASTDKKTQQLVAQYAKRHSKIKNTVWKQLHRAKERVEAGGLLSPPRSSTGRVPLLTERDLVLVLHEVFRSATGDQKLMRGSPKNEPQLVPSLRKEAAMLGEQKPGKHSRSNP